jgi:hypothetical protein
MTFYYETMIIKLYNLYIFQKKLKFKIYFKDNNASSINNFPPLTKTIQFMLVSIVTLLMYSFSGLVLDIGFELEAFPNKFKGF